METNNIKDIWKAGVEESIQSYSEEKLNEMVVQSARKSIRGIYPGIIFRLVVIGVIVSLIVKVILSRQGIEAMFVDMSALVILSVAYFFWERSAYVMRRYTNGMPVKEWLEYRIKEIEKSITFNTKYSWAIGGCSFLCAIGFYASYQIIAHITPNILNVIIIPLGVVIYLFIVIRSLNRNYQKALEALKDLHKQFEDVP